MLIQFLLVVPYHRGFALACLGSSTRHAHPPADLSLWSPQTQELLAPDGAVLMVTPQLDVAQPGTEVHTS